MRWFLLLLGLHATLTSAAPRVITSIAPLAETAAAIMHGVGEPVTLIDAAESPHHFALKPSQLRLLEGADLVIWIDRHFESGFAGLADILPARVQRLELLPALGGDDGHFWFSPRRLRVAAGLIRDALARVDPGNAGVYAANAARLDGDIGRLREELARTLRRQPLAVLTDHAFLSGLAAEFGGLEVEAVHDSHDAHGGIRHLREIEDWLRRKGVRCLLTQHPGSAAVARRLAREHSLEIIDLGTPARGEPAGTVARLDRLRAAFARCATAG